MYAYEYIYTYVCNETLIRLGETGFPVLRPVQLAGRLEGLSGRKRLSLRL